MSVDRCELVLPVPNPRRNGSLDLFSAAHLFAVLMILLLVFQKPLGTQSPSTVRLTWDANTEVDLAGYVLVSGTTSGLYNTSLPLGKTATTAELSCVPGSSRYYAIRAFNTAGAYSLYSNEIRVTCGGAAKLVPRSIGNVVVVVVRRA